MNKPLTKQEWFAYLEKTWNAAQKEAWGVEKQEQKTPLKVLNLTVFTENRLRNGRVYDVETLQAMTSRDILAIPDMGKKALKEVMEALDVYAVNMSQERVDETAKRKHEPVAWVIEDGEVDYYVDVVAKIKPGTPLYAASPKREWVGLTQDEFQKCVDGLEDLQDCWVAIEAKLKEKNA